MPWPIWEMHAAMEKFLTPPSLSPFWSSSSPLCIKVIIVCWFICGFFRTSDDPYRCTFCPYKNEQFQKIPILAKIRINFIGTTHAFYFWYSEMSVYNVFHHTKNSLRRCCVGGDMAILIFGSFQNHVGYIL